LLVTLDDRDLSARRRVVAGQQQAMRRHVDGARAELARARAELELARSKQRRDGELLARGFVSEAGADASRSAVRSAAAGLDAARAALAARQADADALAQEVRYSETVLSYARIVAPMDGIVVQRLAERGDTVVAGSPLLKIVDPASIWVTVRVDESLVGRVVTGQRASIRLRTGAVLAGTVARIARQSDAATRELDVHVAFDQVPERFAIDQEAEVSIAVGDDVGIVVPLAALTRDRDGRAGVLVVDAGRTRFRPVTTVGSNDRQALVGDGLAGGEAVVSDAARVPVGRRARPVVDPAR
jgi:RND family efflux transporter MFP subunit